MAVMFEVTARSIPGMRCHNEKCITTSEKYLPNLFYPAHRGEYRCNYCDHKAADHS